MTLWRDLAWMAMSQALYFVFQFGASICLARLLSPAETGIYAIAFALTGVLAVIQGGGLNGFVIRETLMPPAAIRSAFTINAVMSLLLAGLIKFCKHIRAEIGVADCETIPPVVAIVGGGFSGAFCAVSLAAKSTRAVRILVIEARETLGAGVAYSATDPAHRINVPAARMTLFPDHTTHFDDWVRARRTGGR